MSIESERIRQILADKIKRIHYPRNKIPGRQVIVFYPKPEERLSEEINELEIFIQKKTEIPAENIVVVPVDGSNHIGITIRGITPEQISKLKEDIPEFDSK